jgi:hypothetical protein
MNDRGGSYLCVMEWDATIMKPSKCCVLESVEVEVFRKKGIERYEMITFISVARSS